jgi:signal transduction histidine kinase
MPRATGDSGSVRVGRAGGAGAASSAGWSSLVLEDDLQALLTRAVQELSHATGFVRLAAWGRDDGGTPRVLSARLDGAALREPREDEFQALAVLPAATDLGAPEAGAEAREIAERHGFSAAAAVDGGETAAGAILLVGDPREPPGRVRPRTLAALGRAAERLAGPASAVLAARRLTRMDAEVRRLDRLAALGSLVAEIVHEIRNPLVSVKTFLQLLPERVEEPEFRERFLAVASEELRRVERLLDVVLEHGRPASRRREEESAEVGPIFDSVVQLVSFRAAERAVELALEPAQGTTAVAISPDALRQIVLNLVLNAIEATPSGGVVRLGARSVPGTARPGGSIEAGPGVENVEIRVDDEGPGVPAGLRSRLFEPFFSTRADGPGGLGLSITRRIVEEARGRIEVTGRTEGGSSFRVRLPAAQLPSRPLAP